MHIDRLVKEYEIEVRWVAFPLHPEVPEEGLALKELFAGRNVDIDASLLRLNRVAASLSLPMGAHRMTYNSRLAQELGKWAESRGKGMEFHHAVFQAYFAESKNIARVDELVKLAASVQLSPEEATEVIRARSFREAVDADWARSRDLRVTAVPTFITGDRRIVGFQSYDVLQNLVTKSGASPKRQ